MCLHVLKIAFIEEQALQFGWDYLSFVHLIHVEVILFFSDLYQWLDEKIITGSSLMIGRPQNLLRVDRFWAIFISSGLSDKEL